MTAERGPALVKRAFVPFRGNRYRLLAVAAAFLVPTAAHSSVLYVDSLADESAEGDGASPETAFATLDAAAAAAADGDEIRILGGEGGAYVFASDTNGTRFAQAALRLVGWGGARPVLYPDPEVERTGGQRLFVLAGAGSSASRLAFHFTKASAGKATVLSVQAPDVAVRDCEFELADGPAAYQTGGCAGVVSCDRGCATNLLVEGCTFRNTRPASANWEYRPFAAPQHGRRVRGAPLDRRQVAEQHRGAPLRQPAPEHPGGRAAPTTTAGACRRARSWRKTPGPTAARGPRTSARFRRS